MENKDIKKELNVKKDKKKIVFKIVKIILILALYIVAILVCCKSCKNVKALGADGRSTELWLDYSENSYGSTFGAGISNYFNGYFNLPAETTQGNYYDLTKNENARIDTTNGIVITDNNSRLSSYINVSNIPYCYIMNYDYTTNPIELATIHFFSSTYEYLTYEEYYFELDSDNHRDSYNIYQTIDDFNATYIRIEMPIYAQHMVVSSNNFFGISDCYVPYGVVDCNITTGTTFENQYKITFYVRSSIIDNVRNIQLIRFTSYKNAVGDLYFYYNHISNPLNGAVVSTWSQDMIDFDKTNNVQYFTCYFYYNNLIYFYLVYDNIESSNTDYSKMTYLNINSRMTFILNENSNTLKIKSYPYLTGYEEIDWYVYVPEYTPYSTYRAGIFPNTMAIQDIAFHLIGNVGVYDYVDPEYHENFLFGDLVSSFLNIQFGTFEVAGAQFSLTLGVLVMFFLGLGALFIIIKVMLGG